jgi:precorrin-6A/cobalt-precorrin-6A reductase
LLRSVAPQTPTPTPNPFPKGEGSAAELVARKCLNISGTCSKMRRILILGGTAEARHLAQMLAPRTGLAITLSLAGRTAFPLAQPVAVRIGGFGGPEGLADHIRSERVDALIDATHPYAAIISANAARAAALTGVPILALTRASWTSVAGDHWIEVDDTQAAVRAIGSAPRRVLVTLGRKNLSAFIGAPQHQYLVRSVDPVDPPLAVPHALYINARGPFTQEQDHALMEQHGVEIVISRNSGGDASYGKIAAARALNLPVIMLRRPKLPRVPAVERVQDAVAWLDHAFASSTARGV